MMATTTASTVATSVPVVWHLLDYPFEVGSVIAPLCSCLGVRFCVVQTDRAAHRWTLDIPVHALTMMITAAWSALAGPSPSRPC